MKFRGNQTAFRCVWVCMATMVVSPAMMRLTVTSDGERSTTVREGDGATASRTERLPAPPMASATPVPSSAATQAHFPAVAAQPQSGPASTLQSVRPAEASGETELRARAVAEQGRLAELATQCLKGNTQAWESLVRSQQRRVYGICYRFTGSAAEAEDLTQDAFLKVYRHLATFDPQRASFGVWLTALTRNLLVDHYRRSRMERASESLDEPFSGEDEGPTRAERLPDNRSGQERHMAGLELRAQVQAALAKVSPELREAVIMRDLEDLDYREIADVLRIPQGTVKSRISRGRAELARLLKGMEGQVM